MKQTCNLIAFDTHLLRKKKVITHAERCDSGRRKKARLVCVCVVSGKRIPAVDGSGAAAGKGFKLQPPSSSQRTCCWWCLWPADPTFTPPTLHPSPCSPRPPPCIRPASAHGHRHQAVGGCAVRSVTPRALTPDAALPTSPRLEEVIFPALSNSKVLRVPCDKYRPAGDKLVHWFLKCSFTGSCLTGPFVNEGQQNLKLYLYICINLLCVDQKTKIHEIGFSANYFEPGSLSYCFLFGVWGAHDFLCEIMTQTVIRRQHSPNLGLWCTSEL